jgi:hypothetical protein
MKKKDESKFIGVVIFCDKLKKEVELKEGDFSISTISQDCEMCGSHGSTTLYVTKCECGDLHDIEITSW